MTAKIEAAKWPDDLEVPPQPKLKLLGRDGNAFAVLGNAQAAAKKAKWSQEQIDAFAKIAKAGDYDHLLQTCMRYFDVH